MYVVFALTYLPKAWDKQNMGLNKYNFFLNLAFGQVGEKNESKDCVCSSQITCHVYLYVF